MTEGETWKGEEISHLPEEVQAIIKKLDLLPHPEANSDQGCQGFFKETHRSSITTDGKRATSTVIYYLLAKGGRSHWHKVDADEIWLWHAGSPIVLTIADASGEQDPHTTVRLGGDVLRDEEAHYTIKMGEWQSADAKEGWALVSCVVAPAFEFEGFTLAEKGWAPSSHSKKGR